MNEYFQVGSVPAPNSPGASSVVRQEFTNIASGFDKLPVMAGHAGEIITVNGTGTGLVASGIIAGSFATLTGVETLTNKTMDWAANTFVGFSQGLGIDLKAPINSPAFTGAPSAPTPPTGDASSRLATTFFVTNTIAAIGAVTPGNNLPLMDGVAAPGVDPALVSRQDHVHPSDTSRAPSSAATATGTSFTPAGNIAATDVQLALQELDAEKAPLASPGFTGAPTAPTVADSSDTTTKIATTAWVQTRLTQIPVSVQLSDSNPLQAGAATAPGVGVEASRYDHVHLRQTATQTPNTPAGSIAATNVQDALNELDGDIGLKQAAATAVQKDSQTGAAHIPAGTTAERPIVPLFGDTRGNTTDTAMEWWNGTSWAPMGGAGATGAGSNKAFVENDTLITGDYTIGQGGLATCTISIASPCNITVSNDWVADQMVWFQTTGALPTGLDISKAYYVLATGLTTSNVRLSLTPNGAAINTSGVQSGVHKIAKVKNASIAGQFGTASGVTVTIPPGCTLVNT